MYTYINLDYIDLMTDGDVEMKSTMLEMLLEEIPEELGIMKECLANEQWEPLFQAAHKMKSTLAFIGNNAMTNANKQIEANARQEQNLDSIPQLLQTLESQYHKAAHEIKMALEAASN